MDNVKKIQLAIIAISLALINFQVLAFKKDSLCDLIPGKWEGTSKNPLCIWRGSVEGTLNDTQFSLNGILQRDVNSSKDCAEFVKYYVEGTCTNGDLYTKNYSGYIHDKTLQLYPPYENDFFVKV